MKFYPGLAQSHELNVISRVGGGPPVELRSEQIVNRLELTNLEARVLFHLVNEHTSIEQLVQVLPHATEQEAARSAVQKLRRFVYGERAIR